MRYGSRGVRYLQRCQYCRDTVDAKAGIHAWTDIQARGIERQPGTAAREEEADTDAGRFSKHAAQLLKSGVLMSEHFPHTQSAASSAERGSTAGCRRC